MAQNNIKRNATTAEDVPTRIARNIREQSQNPGRLTSVNSLGRLLPDIDQDTITANLHAVFKSKTNKDIKTIVPSDGVVYFYSETHISENRAAALAQTENYKTEIANKVREDSKNLSDLTNIDALIPLFSTATEAAKIEGILLDIEQDKRYSDIRKIAAFATVYLYSTRYLTESYAGMLSKAKADDKCTTIAGTVREEARIYPRPTNIDFFKSPLFNIKPDELENYFSKTLERPEFKDIKLVTASTGARYLYSDLYLKEEYVKSLVEWEEVGHLDNP